MLQLLLFISLLLFSGFCFAQGSLSKVHPSYVSIQMRHEPLDGPPIVSTICGGVVVDERKKLVATAWHCVPNTKTLVSVPGIFTVNGMSAQLVAFKAEADMALFQVNELRGVKAPTLSTPNKDDVVIASAYYPEFPVFSPSQTSDRKIPQMSINTVLTWEGKVVAVANASIRPVEQYDQLIPTPFKWIVVSGNPAPGFSGGPVFDKSENFVGIISNGNGGFTNISSSANIAILIRSMQR